MYRRQMRTVCQGCGTRREDWEGKEDEEAPFVAMFRICPGCQRLEEERENVPDGTKGVHYELIPTEEAMKQMER